MAGGTLVHLVLRDYDNALVFTGFQAALTDAQIEHMARRCTVTLVDEDELDGKDGYRYYRFEALDDYVVDIVVTIGSLIDRHLWAKVHI